jgi:hypothetical protein
MTRHPPAGARLNSKIVRRRLKDIFEERILFKPVRALSSPLKPER